MEYEQLLINLRTIEQMWWVDVGAFIAANTLLATAFGVSVGGMPNDFNHYAMTAVRIIIPLIGVLFSGAAAYTAIKLRRMQWLTIQRGRELESVLLARVFDMLKEGSGKAPWLTITASLLFGILWLAVMAAALWKL